MENSREACVNIFIFNTENTLSAIMVKVSAIFKFHLNTQELCPQKVGGYTNTEIDVIIK